MAELYEAAQANPEAAKAKAAGMDEEMTALASRLVALTPVINIEFWVMVRLALGAHIDAQQVGIARGCRQGRSTASAAPCWSASMPDFSTPWSRRRRRRPA